MKAIMLAAGLGRRLYGDDNHEPPKALIGIGGKTLLARHVEALLDFGVDELILVVGHGKEELLAEAAAVAPEGFIRSRFNPRYREAPILSLWTARDELAGGGESLFMDADVLYHPELLERVIRSPQPNCFIMDRDLEPGEEPVKICLKDGVVVDFGKQVTDDFDIVGEWPGFLKMSPDVSAKVAAMAQQFVDDGKTDVTYEEVFRAVLMAEPPETFGVEDITGIPWIEIDFQSDLMRAEKIIYPQVAEFEPETDASPREKASGE